MNKDFSWKKFILWSFLCGSVWFGAMVLVLETMGMPLIKTIKPSPGVVVTEEKLQDLENWLIAMCAISGYGIGVSLVAKYEIKRMKE